MNLKTLLTLMVVLCNALNCSCGLRRFNVKTNLITKGSTESSEDRRSVRAESTVDGRSVSNESIKDGHSVGKESTKGGHSVGTESTKDGRSVSAESTKGGHSVGTESTKDGHSVSTESSKDGRSEVKNTTTPRPTDADKQQYYSSDVDRIEPTPVSGTNLSKKTDNRSRFQREKKRNTQSFPKRSIQINTTLNASETDLKSVSDTGLPCNITVKASDTIVDCTNRDLTTLSSEQFPENTTVLYLDQNDLKELTGSFFSHLMSLRHLSISNNQIERIETDTFRGLQNLRYLGLEMNDLEYTYESFPENIFTPLENLEEIRLLQNKPFEKGGYPDKFLGSLRKLQTLTIDTVGDTLNFGNEFNNLTRLRSLTITGNALYINADSFENVAVIKELCVLYLTEISNVSINAFKPLKNLESLTLSYIEIGLNHTLSLLHPFVGRNMSKIVLDKISLSVSQQDKTILSHDGSLNAHNTTLLMGICVKSFTLTDSNIYVIESSAFENSTLWDSCLESIDLSYNPLTGSVLALSRILRFKNLITFTTTDVYQRCTSFGEYNTVNDNIINRHVSQVFSDRLTSKGQVAPRTSDLLNFHLLEEKATPDDREDDNDAMVLQSNGVITKPAGSLLDTHKTATGPVISAYVSKSLREFHGKRLIASSPLNMHLHIVNGGNINIVDLSNSGFHEFTGVIEGLSNLKILLLSGNDMSVISENFFDTLSSLETLKMATCKLDRQFIAMKSKRLISKLVRLKSMDLSYNYLYILPKDIFSYNPNLEELVLAGNNFKEIPFDLTTTPNLTRLDLRYNSLTSLDAKITLELDDRVQSLGEFQLKLKGNVLSCGCESIGFLHWMTVTNVEFDNHKNFTCINSAGDLSDTAQYTDLVELWRLCWGKYFLAAAVILLCFIVIGFLAVFLFVKNKTLILSTLLQFIWGFELKKRSDYATGVYIGYSDSDYNFPCHALRVYLENTLQLSTYLEHRDLLPSADKASAIIEAIHACWRVVLVINRRFLNGDEWALFTMKSAIHSQSPSNPARLMVIVEDAIRRFLPNELLSVVSEENIFVVTRWTLGTELKDWLKLRLYF